MKNRVVLALLAAFSLLLGAVGGSPVQAGHDEDIHSSNIKQLAEVPIIIGKDDPKTEQNEKIQAQGTDLAFEGDLVIAGSYQGVGVFKTSKKSPYLKQIGFVLCNGAQGDVSVWNDLVFVSIDTPQDTDKCTSINAGQPAIQGGTAWEGVRIFSIKNPRNPQMVGSIKADCGSHTNTLLPKNGKLYMLIHSYPLAGGLSKTCNVGTHRKNFIAQINLKNPGKSKTVGSLDVSPAIGCHDVAVYPERNIAAAACLTESQLWNIKNPAKPTIISRIRNPFMVAHSTAFTWDGKYILLGDEFAGAAAGAGCTDIADGRVGALWFYDVTDPAAPKEAGHYGPPRTAYPDSPTELLRHSCTNHNFNVVPMKKKGKYIAVTSYYAAGLSVVDFSDPANAKEIGYYVPQTEGEKPDMWSAYWYNGRVYTNDVNLPRASASLPGTASAGVRAFWVKGLTRKETHYFADRLNPQVQIQKFR